MVNFILIAVCIIAGMVFKATKSIHPDAHKGINTWILYLALPAVSFKYLPKVEWSKEMLFPILSTVVIAVGSIFFMKFYSKAKGYSERSRRSLELASGYSNTSFIGFPLIAAFYGEQYLSILLSGETFKPVYDKLGLHSRNLARTLEDAGTVINPLVPWSVCGVFISHALGVPVWEYLPYAFFCYLSLALTLVFGWTGLTLSKK